MQDGAQDPASADAAPGGDGLAALWAQLRADGGAGLRGSLDTLVALRRLAAADVALARAALGRALALAAVAVAFGASGSLLLLAALVAALRLSGLSWLAALLVAAALSLAVTALAAWGTLRYLRHTRLSATRRQLARLGLGDGDGADATAPAEPATEPQR